MDEKLIEQRKPEKPEEQLTDAWLAACTDGRVHKDTIAILKSYTRWLFFSGGTLAPPAAWNTRADNATIEALRERVRVMEGDAQVDRAEKSVMWRNGVTNTAIVIDLARKKYHSALRRNRAFLAFDRDLNAMLDDWFKATRSSTPETYDEAELVWKGWVERRALEKSHD